MTTESILLENVAEYYSNAIAAKSKGQFNTAVTLLFKTASALCDLFIYRNHGRIPSSHADRLRILENKYEAVYSMLDRDFSFYQDSYTKRLTKEVSEILEDDVRKISNIVGINLQEIR